jgi:hypothetical protein
VVGAGVRGGVHARGGGRRELQRHLCVRICTFVQSEQSEYTEYLERHHCRLGPGAFDELGLIEADAPPLNAQQRACLDLYRGLVR